MPDHKTPTPKLPAGIYAFDMHSGVGIANDCHSHGGLSSTPPDIAAGHGFNSRAVAEFHDAVGWYVSVRRSEAGFYGDQGADANGNPYDPHHYGLFHGFYYYYEDTYSTVYDANGYPKEVVDSRRVWWFAGSNAANTQFYSDWVEWGLHPHETITREFIIFSGPNPFHHETPPMNSDVAAIALGLLAASNPQAAAAAAIALGVGDIVIAGPTTRTIYVPRESLGGYFGSP